LQQLTHGDAARADDLAQQAFVQAWRALAGFRGEARVTVAILIALSALGWSFARDANA